MRIAGTPGNPVVTTTTPRNHDFVIPRGYKGILLRLNVSVLTATDVVGKVQYFDEVRETFEDLTDATAAGTTVVAFETLAAAGEREVMLYPGIAEAKAAIDDNKRYSLAPPKKLRVVLTFTALTTATYSIAGLPLE